MQYILHPLRPPFLLENFFKKSSLNPPAVRKKKPFHKALFRTVKFQRSFSFYENFETFSRPRPILDKTLSHITQCSNRGLHILRILIIHRWSLRSLTLKYCSNYSQLFICGLTYLRISSYIIGTSQYHWNSTQRIVLRKVNIHTSARVENSIAKV